MGLFDKKLKKPSDFDIDVSMPPLATPVPGAIQITPRLKADHPDYGINKAIELMRMLPNENVELIVRVVKTTLESTNINVAGIIKDAIRKQGGIESRIDVLKKEIGALEAEIATRRGEITTLEADHRETAMVKERLVLAEKLTAPVDRPTPQPPATPTGQLRPLSESADPTRTS